MQTHIKCNECSSLFEPPTHSSRYCSDVCRKDHRRKYRTTRKKLTRVQANTYHHKSRLKKKYGITVQQFDEMLIQQQGRCYICDEWWVGGRTMMVDHCHETGQVRKLLCFHCNTALGLVQDRIERLEAMIDYLKETH